MIYIAVFITSLFLSLRKILLTTKIVGHNWDYSFPYPQELFSRIHYYSSYTWVDLNLGSIPTMNISQYFPNRLLSFMGAILGSILTTKLLFIIILITAFFGFKKLLDYFIGKKDTNYLFSFLFAFSPFLFSEIIGGSWYMWISYAVSPLLTLYTLRFIINNDKKSLIPCIGIVLISISSLQNFVSLGSMLFSFVLYKGVVEKKCIKYVKRGLLLIIIILGINCFWLLNLIVSITAFSKDVFTNSTFAGTFSGVRDSTQTILSIFNLTGYLDRNLYYYTFSEGIKSFFIITFPIVWLLIFYTLFKHDTKKISQKDFLFWFILYLCSIFIIKGGNHPFSDASMIIFTSIPIMKLYRSPQHLMFIPSFIIPILLAYTCNFYQNNVRKKKYLFIFLSITIFIWISGWIITGDFGMKILAEQNRDHIDLFNLPPGLTKLYHDLKSDPLEGRILFLPSVISPKYIKNPFQNQAQGGIPEYPYLSKPTFTAEHNTFANTFESRFCGKKTFNFIHYVSLFSVKEIIVRRDIQGLYSDCRLKLNTDKTIAILDKEPLLKRSYADKYLIRYAIDRTFFVPYIFIPSKLEIVNNNFKDLSQMVSKNIFTPGTSYMLHNQKKLFSFNKSKIYTKPKINPPIVEFKKINPVKYKIQLLHVSSKFPLIFNSSFHSNWKIYQDDTIKKQSSEFVSNVYSGTRQNNNLNNGTWYEMMFRPVIVNSEDHFMVNGYANAWIIDPQKICRIQKCKKNSDGSFNIDLILYFNQQNILYLGIIITSMTVLLLLFYTQKRN